MKLQCMLEICHDHIVSKISESSYVMADHTIDISEHEQSYCFPL